MKNIITCFIVLLLVMSNITANAYTVTFDDISAGQNLSYYQNQYGLGMVPGWQVTNSVTSGWGTPHSGTQAAIWNGNSKFATGFDFGIDGVSEYTVSSVGAYFTTQPGVILEMHGYTASGVVTARIGEAEQSWNNHYAGINSSVAGNILFVHIVGISSPDARYHFSMDDLTVTPVPEPSSLAALALSLFPLAGCALQKGKH